MDHDGTDELGRHRRKHDNIKLGVAIVTACATLVFGVVSFAYQRTLTAIDADRHRAEITERTATNFVMAYFESTCAERAEMMQFPLERWFNWRTETCCAPTRKKGHPTSTFRSRPRTPRPPSWVRCSTAIRCSPTMASVRD